MTQTALLCPKSQKHDARDVWKAYLTKNANFVGKYEFPELLKCDYIPDKLIAFHNTISKKADNSCVHFYTHDNKFECLWNSPNRYIDKLKSYGYAIAPDFSLYREMPLNVQISNTYRGRVVGHWLTENGITVIPNVRWSDERSYKFCFDGIPQNSVVAVGTHGCVKKKDDIRFFHDGFHTMLERINPKAVVVYGSSSERVFLPIFTYDVQIIPFSSDFSQFHKEKEMI